jgi:hypothetical protein
MMHAVNGILQVLTYVSGVVVTVSVYRWHRREIHAGRRVPVFFGKGKRYPQPGNGHVPFDKAMMELSQKLEHRPTQEPPS